MKPPPRKTTVMYLTEYEFTQHEIFQRYLLACAGALPAAESRLYHSFVCQSPQRKQIIFQVKDGKTSRSVVQCSEVQFLNHLGRAQMACFILLVLYNNGADKEALESLKASGLLMGVTCEVRGAFRNLGNGASDRTADGASDGAYW